MTDGVHAPAFQKALVDAHAGDQVARLARLVEQGILDLDALDEVATFVAVVFSSDSHQEIPILRPRRRLDDCRFFDAAVIDAGLQDYVRPITPEEWITCPTEVPGPLYVHLTQVKPGLVRRAPMGLTFLGDAPPDVSSPSGPEPASQEPHGGPDATRQG